MLFLVLTLISVRRCNSKPPEQALWIRYIILTNPRKRDNTIDSISFILLNPSILIINDNTPLSMIISEAVNTKHLTQHRHELLFSSFLV